MKRTIRSIIVALFLSLSMMSLGFAQQQAEDIKGMQVQNQQGEDMGSVKDVLLGPDGNIQAVIVEKGGFLGLGGTTNKIPWNALKESQNKDHLVYNQAAGQEQGQQQDQVAKQQQDQGQQQDQVAKQQQDQGQQQDQVAEQQQDQGQQQDLAQGQQGRQSQQQGGQGQADVVVRQPAPQVTVDQPEAQVRVDQAEPKVTVDQPQPKVTVTQPAPKVKVQVEQPKPEVTVQQPQPRVNVQQQQPEVAVKQPKPEVQVEQQKPEVAVQQSKPEVQIEKQGQPQVYMDKQEQAQVEIKRQGKPQVEVVTSPQQQGSGQSQQRGAVQMTAAQADKLMGQPLIGKNGDALGTVKKTHLAQDGQSVQYFIVQGKEDNKLHPVPVELVQVNPDQKELKAPIDQATFQNSPSFKEDQQPQLSQQQWAQDIQSYYGISPAWQSGQSPSADQPMSQQPGQQPQAGSQNKNQ